MHPEIMMPASKLFYQGLLESADLDIAHRCQDPAFQFIDTAGCGFDESASKARTAPSTQRKRNS